MLVTFLVSHLEISGKERRSVQELNNDDIFLILLVFHVDISGKDNNDEHSSNKPAMLVVF